MHITYLLYGKDSQPYKSRALTSIGCDPWEEIMMITRRKEDFVLTGISCTHLSAAALLCFCGLALTLFIVAKPKSYQSSSHPNTKLRNMC